MPGYVSRTTTARRPDCGTDTPTAALGQKQAKAEDKYPRTLQNRLVKPQQTANREKPTLSHRGKG